MDQYDGLHDKKRKLTEQEQKKQRSLCEASLPYFAGFADVRGKRLEILVYILNVLKGILKI